MSGTYIQLPPTGGSPFFLDPVATAADLPVTGDDTGAIRVVLDTDDIYEWDGTAWQQITNSSADVSGPASSTDNAFARFDGTSGKVIQNSLVTCDDSGIVTAPGFVGPLTGDVTGNCSGTSSTITGLNTIVHGGTNSSTALNNNRVMQSSAGAIVEAAAITAARALISDANGIPTHSVTTATELSYVNGVTSSIQTQINSIVPQLPSVNAFVYISQFGDDTTGDGTFNRPWATTAKVMSAITDASASKRYGVHVRGTIVEVNVYIKPYIWYFGDTWGCSRLSASSGNVTLNPGSFAAGNSRCGMTNIYLTGSTGINLDFVSAAAAGSHVIEIQSVGVNGSITITPNNTNQYFQWEGDSLVFGGFTAHGALGLIFNTFFAGDIVIDQASTPAAMGGINFVNCFFGGNFTHSSSGSFSNPVQLTACTVAGTISSTGIGADLIADSISLPLKASITTASGATLTRSTDVFSLAYAPTTTADWNSVPAIAQSALDTLATSGVVKSQSQNLVLASPNGSSGVPTFRAIATADLPATTILSATQATNTATGVGASGVWGSPISLSITAGTWQIQGVAGMSENGAALTTALEVGISAAANGTGMGAFDESIMPFLISSTSDAQITTPMVYVTLGSTTTYYLNTKFYYSSGTPQHRGKIIAVRI